MSIVKRLQENEAGPQQVVQLNSTGHIFSMDDMRSFHHFIITAHPVQPFANDVAWVQRIPAVAYEASFIRS